MNRLAPTVVLAAVLVEACAAGRVPTAPTATELVPQPLEYERILGAFALDPHLVVFINPAICERYCSSDTGGLGLRHVAQQLAVQGIPQGEAAARLNFAAILWSHGHAEDAYRELMRAHRIYAALGDVDGLAHAYEWLGYIFLESGIAGKAAEHLGIAKRLFELLGNQGAARRVLAYAD